jgi:hypothetical protein
MFNNKKVPELEREVERLEQLIEAHETAYNELAALYDKRNKDLNDASRDLPVTLNFGAMGAFSVERLIKNNEPVTVVGYFINDRVPEGDRIVTVQQVREWYLHCSDKVHKDVVKQFNEYMEERKARLF